MGGKNATTTQQVQIPADVLARYNAVNAQAQTTAATPFQSYGTDPNKFVAPVNEQQYSGIGDVNAFAQEAQPAYGVAQAGTAGLAAAAMPENFQSGVANYYNPFLERAVGATAAQMENVNEQERSKMLGSMVGSGAFGGDRANIGLAALENQQNLAMGQTLGQMESQGFQNAAQNYFQGLGASGNLFNQLAGLGAGAQGAALQGAQAKVGAGSLEQQTEQAGLAALYNQFQQQRAYPFQVSQFLANIAEGTGALSGSTTTTTQPTGFFSDRRLKEGIERVGHTDDGLPIYKFRYKGDPAEQTHIGFMADEVEKKHPDAVGVAGGFKTVDYDRATKAEGGVVGPDSAGQGFYDGGIAGAPVGGIGIPLEPAPQHNLAVAGNVPQLPGGNALSDAAAIAKGTRELYGDATDVKDWLSKHFGSSDVHSPTERNGNAAGGGVYSDSDDPMATVISAGSKTPAELKAASQAPTSAPSSAADDIGKAAGIGKDLLSAGKTIGSIASGAGALSDVLPLLAMLKSGGRVGRAEGGPVDPNAPQGTSDERDPTATPTIAPTPSGTLGDAVHPALKPAVDPTFDNLLHVARHAIGTMESSNKYGTIGPTVTHKNGVTDRAYGAYGVMGSNVGPWTKEALGKEMTPEEFVNDPGAQDAVFNHQFGKILKTTGNPYDAASVWFSGKKRSDVGPGVHDVLGTTVPAYVSKFARASGLADAPLDGQPAFGVEGAVASSRPGEVPSGVAAASMATPTPASDSTTSPPQEKGGVGGFLSGLMPTSPEGKMALLSGVFGMLASPNHYLLQAIGSGGLAGVQTYQDMIKLRNESLKNAIAATGDMFTTTDGETFYNKLTGETMAKAQHAAFVQNLMSRAGLGGMGGMPYSSPAAQIVGTMPPLPDQQTPSAGAASATDSGAVGTAKQAVASPMAPAASASPAPTGEPKTALEILTRNYNNPDVWKGKDLWYNAPALNAKADEQQQLAVQLQAKAQAAARVGNSSLSQDYTAQAGRAMEQSKFYRDTSTKVLQEASQQDIDKLNDMLKLGRETTTTQATPEAPETLTTKADLVKRAQAGEPVVVKPSPYQTERAKAVQEMTSGMTKDNITNKQLQSRMDQIASIVENFETGGWSSNKAEILKRLKAVGFDVDESSIAPVEEIVKNSINQVYDQAKNIGNKVLVAEIEGLSKAVPGADLQPGSNKYIIGSTKGLLEWQNKYYNDFMDWRKNNPQDLHPEYWEQQWLNDPKNDPKKWMEKGQAEVAPKGMKLPDFGDKSQWKDGEKYNIPGKGVLWWDAKKGKLVDQPPGGG